MIKMFTYEKYGLDCLTKIGIPILNSIVITMLIMITWKDMLKYMQCHPYIYSN